MPVVLISPLHLSELHHNGKKPREIGEKRDRRIITEFELPQSFIVSFVTAFQCIASQFGLTEWQKDESFYAAKTCFIAWQNTFGVNGHRKDRAMMAQVRAFFESYGASRFDNANSPNNDKIIN